MFSKSLETTFLIVLSMTSFSICHIIRRDASEEVISVAVETEEQGNGLMNQLPLGGYSETSFNSQEEESTNVLGNWYPDGGDSEEEVQEHDSANDIVIEIPSTSAGETHTSTSDPTTPQDGILNTVTIATSSEETRTSTSDLTLHGDVLNEATTVGQHRNTSTVISEHEEAESCYEPPENQLRLNFKSSNMHVKFPALAVLRKEGASAETEYGYDLSGDGSSGPVDHRDEYVNLTCPVELLRITGMDDVSARSLCPWSYVADVDPNRYPSRIMFAKCHCPNCIDTGRTEGSAFSNDNTCHQVFFRMKVLRKGSCVNGIYMYYTEYEDIPVACACVRPKV